MKIENENTLLFYFKLKELEYSKYVIRNESPLIFTNGIAYKDSSWFHIFYIRKSKVLLSNVNFIINAVCKKYCIILKQYNELSLENLEYHTLQFIFKTIPLIYLESYSFKSFISLVNSIYESRDSLSVKPERTRKVLVCEPDTLFKEDISRKEHNKDKILTYIKEIIQNDPNVRLEDIFRLVKEKYKGISENTIIKYIKENNIKLMKYTERQSYVIKLHTEGKSKSEIVNITGYSKRSIFAIINKYESEKLNIQQYPIAPKQQNHTNNSILLESVKIHEKLLKFATNNPKNVIC